MLDSSEKMSQTPAQERLDALMQELTKIERRLGTGEELEGDVDRVQKIAHDARNVMQIAECRIELALRRAHPSQEGGDAIPLLPMMRRPAVALP